jgi:hypothetical protein
MTDSPKVVFNYKFELAINNPDRHKKNTKKIIKNTTGMFDYYSDEEKQAMNLFDYYTGVINKKERMNLILENGKLATKSDIEKRKKEYVKYINNSNLAKCVVSFNNDYINENIDIHKLEQKMVKEVIPMFLRKCGYVDIKKMSYQLSLHTDTDNLHFHFSFIEKAPNFAYANRKIGYKRKGIISEDEINFLKNEVEHVIEKEKIYTPLLKETNKEIEELKSYFNPNEKNFLLKDKKDLILEENILRLGQLLYEKRGEDSKRIKYNSIRDNEIKDLTKKIKNYIFSKKNIEFQNDYKNFQNSLKEINNYFYKIAKDNNIKDTKLDTTLIDSKQEYIDNYIYNSIVNHANYLYKNKSKNILNENKIIEEIVLKEYLKNKKQSRYNILKNYLSNSSNKLKFKNRYKIEQAIKNINNEMDDAQKEFSKLFNSDYELI